MSLSVPSGKCYPTMGSPIFFSVTIKVCAKLKIERTSITTITNPCDPSKNKTLPPKTDPVIQPKGCQSFNLDFLKIGNGYVCTNVSSYTSTMKKFIDSVENDAKTMLDSDINGQSIVQITKKYVKCIWNWKFRWIYV
jgi:hypothetical protein